jgi:endoglucanase
MFDDVKSLVLSLCPLPGTSGDENEVYKSAEEFLGFTDQISCDSVCGLIAVMGDDVKAEKKIVIDAHIDQIGLAVTEIDEKGFLHFTNVGGIDLRTLPGYRVTVFGKEKVTGIISVLPPHISGDDLKIPQIDDQVIDIGMSREEATKIIHVGDRAILTKKAGMLLGNRVSGTALDDRSGCAAVIRTAQLLKGRDLKNCAVYFVLSSNEEIGGQGAIIAGQRILPDEAVAVDVSFAKQPGVNKKGLSELGKGPIIGYSSLLDRKMTQQFIEIAEKNRIPYQTEVMGGETDTNGDAYMMTGNGVKCALISIPQKNMHTPSEVCDLEDVENTAKLISEYILSKV